MRFNPSEKTSPELKDFPWTDGSRGHSQLAKRKDSRRGQPSGSGRSQGDQAWKIGKKDWRRLWWAVVLCLVLPYTPLTSFTGFGWVDPPGNNPGLHVLNIPYRTVVALLHRTMTSAIFDGTIPVSRFGSMASRDGLPYYDFPPYTNGDPYGGNGGVAKPTGATGWPVDGSAKDPAGGTRSEPAEGSPAEPSTGTVPQFPTGTVSGNGDRAQTRNEPASDSKSAEKSKKD